MANGLVYVSDDSIFALDARAGALVWSYLASYPASSTAVADVSHELAGHVARSIAGESSLLGLLGMSTKGYLVTEEELADYYERQKIGKRRSDGRKGSSSYRFTHESLGTDSLGCSLRFGCT